MNYLLNIEGVTNPEVVAQENFERLDALLAGGNRRLFTTLARITKNNPGIGVYTSLADASLAGSRSIPGGTLQAGTMIRLFARGWVADDGSVATADIQVLLGAEQLASQLIAAGVNVGPIGNGNIWIAEFIGIVRSIGATGKVIGTLKVERSSENLISSFSGSEQTVDTTGALTLDLQGQVSATDGSNHQLVSEYVTAELIAPPLA
jgi:hypothetical protein